VDRAFRVSGWVVGAAVAGVAFVVVALAALIGSVFLILWIGQPSASAYARSHVQSLFIDNASRSTGTVKSCRAIGSAGEPGEKIWACHVAGKDCVRTFRFVVDHEYGTEPYDNRSTAGTNNPCLAASG
jgi:hypothetical protein